MKYTLAILAALTLTAHAQPTLANSDDITAAKARANHTGTQLSSTLSDSTTAGRALLTAADAVAQRTSLGLGTAATTAATDYATAAQGAKANNPIDIPNLVCAFDFSRSNKLLKADGTTAGEGDAVARINDADAGPYYLNQSTVASQWLRSVGKATKPATPAGYDLNSLPVNYQRATFVVIYGPRTSPTDYFDSNYPWLSSSGVGGMGSGSAVDYIYNPVRTGSAWNEDAINIKAISYGTASTLSANNNRTMTLAANNAATDTLTALMVMEGNASYKLNLTIRAFYIYDRALSADEIQSIRNYHGIPVKTMALIGVGDSIVNGQGATTVAQTWLQIAGVGLGASIVNSGNPGQSMQQRVAVSSAIRAAIFETGLRNVVVVSEGTNDLGTGRTAAQLQADWITYCTEFRASNPTAKLIGCTLLPRAVSFSGGANSTTFAADRTTFNTWLRANYATYMDGIADFGDLSITKPDGIHPNDAGHATIAATVQAAVNALSW